MEFQTGDLVTLKHYTQRNYNKGFVVSCQNDKLVVKPDGNSIIFSYFKDDPLVLGYQKEDELFICECKILGLEYNIEYVNLEIKEIQSIKNRRQEDRLPTSLYGVVIGASVKGTVYICNLSTQGMGIITKCKLNIGDLVEIETFLEGELLHTKSLLTSKIDDNNSAFYGLKIINEDTETQCVIEKHLEILKQHQKEAILRFKDKYYHLSSIKKI